MGGGFDFVYADDDEVDVIDCNDEGGYRIVRDDFDDLDNCPTTSSATSGQPSAASAEETTAADGGEGTATVVEVSEK